MNDPILRARTVRLPKRLDDLVKRLAIEEGVTVSQWIREAILVRATYRNAMENPELIQDLERALRELRDETM